jgi:hypothetical protein
VPVERSHTPCKGPGGAQREPSTGDATYLVGALCLCVMDPVCLVGVPHPLSSKGASACARGKLARSAPSGQEHSRSLQSDPLHPSKQLHRRVVTSHMPCPLHALGHTRAAPEDQQVARSSTHSAVRCPANTLSPMAAKELWLGVLPCERCDVPHGSAAVVSCSALMSSDKAKDDRPSHVGDATVILPLGDSERSVSEPALSDAPKRQAASFHSLSARSASHQTLQPPPHPLTPQSGADSLGSRSSPTGSEEIVTGPTSMDVAAAQLPPFHPRTRSKESLGAVSFTMAEPPSGSKAIEELQTAVEWQRQTLERMQHESDSLRAMLVARLKDLKAEKANSLALASALSVRKEDSSASGPTALSAALRVESALSKLQARVNELETGHEGGRSKHRDGDDSPRVYSMMRELQRSLVDLKDSVRSESTRSEDPSVEALSRRLRSAELEAEEERRKRHRAEDDADHARREAQRAREELFHLSTTRMHHVAPTLPLVGGSDELRQLTARAEAAERRGQELQRQLSDTSGSSDRLRAADQRLEESERRRAELEKRLESMGGSDRVPVLERENSALRSELEGALARVKELESVGSSGGSSEELERERARADAAESRVKSLEATVSGQGECGLRNFASECGRRLLDWRHCLRS